MNLNKFKLIFYKIKYFLIYKVLNLVIFNRFQNYFIKNIVKLGLYKKTKERVAIKILKKEKAKQNEIELVKTEIDIMKLCHHPNIVKLLDHFENVEYSRNHII